MLSYAADEFSIAGSLEPAYDIGGDTFDYAVDSTASPLPSPTPGATACGPPSWERWPSPPCNSRRCGEGLVDQARAANAALLSQFSEEDFVTAALLRIDLPSGSTAVINAGYPPGAGAGGPDDDDDQIRLAIEVRTGGGVTQRLQPVRANEEHHRLAPRRGNTAGDRRSRPGQRTQIEQPRPLVGRVGVVEGPFGGSGGDQERTEADRHRKSDHDQASPRPRSHPRIRTWSSKGGLA